MYSDDPVRADPDDTVINTRVLDGLDYLQDDVHSDSELSPDDLFPFYESTYSYTKLSELHFDDTAREQDSPEPPRMIGPPPRFLPGQGSQGNIRSLRDVEGMAREAQSWRSTSD